MLSTYLAYSGHANGTAIRRFDRGRRLGGRATPSVSLPEGVHRLRAWRAVGHMRVQHGEIVHGHRLAVQLAFRVVCDGAGSTIGYRQLNHRQHFFVETRETRAQ